MLSPRVKESSSKASQEQQTNNNECLPLPAIGFCSTRATYHFLPLENTTLQLTIPCMISYLIIT